MNDQTGKISSTSIRVGAVIAVAVGVAFVFWGRSIIRNALNS